MEQRYWDSSCCLRWLNKEFGYEKCKEVIAKAEAGEIKIVTSVLTMAEVIYLNTKPKIDRRKSDEISCFFENEYIVLINVDRHIAESSRNLLWDYSALRPNDAIHIASAIESEIPIVDTFDKYLISLNDKIGVPPLIIGEPDISSDDGIFRLY
ncbi:MAG: PIN domain-containing protein [Nitrospirae bacterium]|nr:PIN domain-containing protein [Nitrospirota bacterium]